MKTALVIMAAGMGSRFGGGIKQLEPVGPNGEIIMDYSIHDAIEAGFNKVVFIIRKDIKEAFHDAIGKRIEGICNRLNVEFAYAYQELDDLPEEIKKPVDRSKPWGTGQAVLVCKDIIKEPFVVINADDYYGKEAFVKLHDFLVEHAKMGKEFDMGMAGFILKNTLSENGTVTRGVCKVDDNNLLKEVYETTGIKAEGDKIVCDNPEVEAWAKPESNVSMNMWAGYPDFLDYLEKDFSTFLSNISDNPMKKEYLLPNIVAELLREDRINVKVLETHDKWFGVTYAEDKEYVQNAFKQLIEDGVYPEKLWK